MTDQQTGSLIAALIVGTGAAFVTSYALYGKAPDKDHPAPFLLGGLTMSIAYLTLLPPVRHR